MLNPLGRRDSTAGDTHNVFFIFIIFICLFIIVGQGEKCTVYVCTVLCTVYSMFFVRTVCLRQL